MDRLASSLPSDVRRVGACVVEEATGLRFPTRPALQFAVAVRWKRAGRRSLRRSPAQPGSSTGIFYSATSTRSTCAREGSGDDPPPGNGHSCKLSHRDDV
jgi:hypothetical protein